MARGRQRIRVRGSRQQWAQARSLKEVGSETDPSTADGAEATVPKPLSGRDVVATTRCGLCGVVTEQRLRSDEVLVLVPNALCISCDEVRCEDCWSAPDDACVGVDEHEFLEIRYQEDGQVRTADFSGW